MFTGGGMLLADGMGSGLGDSLAVGDSLGLDVTVTVGAGIGDPDGVGDVLRLGDGDSLGVTLGAGVGELLPLGLGLGEHDGMQGLQNGQHGWQWPLHGGFQCQRGQYSPRRCSHTNTFPSYWASLPTSAGSHSAPGTIRGL